MTEFLISGLRAVVQKTAEEFEPALLSPITAMQAIEEWGLIEKLACAAKLKAAERAAEFGVDADAAVAGASGVSQGAARRQNKARRKARKKTKKAMDEGKISAAQAEAIANATEANPDAEDTLLDLAGQTNVNDLQTECERVRRAAMDDADLARRQRAARSFRSWKDELGMTRFSGALPPLDGARFLAELDRRADKLFRGQSRAKQPIDTKEQRMADALVSLLASSGDGAGRGPRTLVRLIVTKDAAERGFMEPGERCETADGTQVPMNAVYDAFLDPDTKVQEVTVDGTDVQSIRTLRKYIPQALRDALEAMGMRCEKCGNSKGLQIDHIEERRDGGATTLTNLGWKCPQCHWHKTATRTREGPPLKDTG